MTPPAVENPGMEIHIHPFELIKARDKTSAGLYLHTSPEFYMKELLAMNQDLTNIFNLSYCFRDEPDSPIHRNQFLMLEWYRKNERYEKIMYDIVDLIKYCQQYLAQFERPIVTTEHFPNVTVQELFQDYLNFDILDFLDSDDLKNKIEKDFKDVPLPHASCSWDDYFFLLFLNKIEPQLINYPFLLIKEYPAPLSALSTLKENDPRVCERFEVYMNGVELCNCFNEITDHQELKLRFKAQQQEKKIVYNYELPWPNRFMKIMKDGYPKSSGIALGVERLLHSLTGIEQPFFNDNS